MSILKSEAIVLKTHDFQETSKIVSVYSKEYGRLQLIAKGVRSPKSKFGALLDGLNYLRILYYFKETRELQFLSNAELVKVFSHLRDDLDRFSYASIIAEIIYRTQLLGERNLRLFHTIISSFEGINASENYRNYFEAFLMRFIEISGFHPKLRRCLNCGQPPRGARVYFDFDRGGYLCEKCSVNQSSQFYLSLEGLNFLLALRDYSWQNIGIITVSEQILLEIERFLLYYLKIHFEGLTTLRAVNFLRSVH
ncbi:MAG: DNA repair protein RecO [Calditrichaeota bacterium]|nr:DNA repair protein RecO [Calditrichota bacterium]